jgi:hypothetical protein
LSLALITLLTSTASSAFLSLPCAVPSKSNGTLADITDPAHLERLRALPLYPWAPGEKSRYVRVRPLSVTGRRITIPDGLPFTWWG